MVYCVEFSLTISVLLLSVAYSKATGSSYSAFDDKIVRIIENHRKDLADGNWIFPPFDPFVLEPFNVTFEQDFINLTIESKLMVVTGPTAFENLEIENDLNNGKFYIYANEPLIYVHGQYISTGQLEKNTPVNGAGSYSANVSNFEITAKGKFDVNEDGKLTIKKLNFILHVDKLKFHINGLQGGKLYNEFISALVSDLAPAFINANIPLFDLFVSKAVKVYLNPILENYTPDDIIDFINEFDD